MSKFYFSPKHANQGADQRRDILLKKKNKLRGESIEAVFRFPKNMLEKYASEDKSKTMKKYRSSEKISEKTIQLGMIGREVEHNLRKTILNHTQIALSPETPSKSTFLSTSSGRRNGKNGNDTFRNMQQESNKKTLSLLQKAIIKEDQLFYFTQDLLELHTSKLPILRKKERERKKHQQYLHKSPMATQFSKQKYKTSDKIATERRVAACKQQKPYIRGWDIVQIQQM